MDYGNNMGAVACPVCTLFLREGISLQKHLDTHPKEQVIEALIKASASSTSQDSSHQPSSSPNQIDTQPPVNSTSQVSSPSPYPLGPLFECPSTLNAVLSPPQFASFSYQQFVNNGTVMIPQYAMAPQNNPMMQMLYSPYGMYHQQPVPTVQMIAPVTPAASTTAVNATNHANRFKSANITSINDSFIKGNPSERSYTCPETRSLLPEVLQEEEPQVLLPDADSTLSSRSSTSKEQSSRCDRIVQNQSSMERREEQTQISNEEERNDESPSDQRNYRDIVTPETINDESDTIQLKIESKETLIRESVIAEKFSGTSKLSKDCSSVINTNVSDKTGQNAEKEQEQAQDSESNKKEDWKQCLRSRVSLPSESDQNVSQPEVEQLEHLLITIIESDYVEDKVTQSKNSHNVRQISKSKEVLQESENRSDNDISPTNSHFNKSLPITSDNLILNMDCNQAYHSKNSVSAPTSPTLLRKSHKSHSRLSLRSDFGSNENVSIYPIGFEAAVLHNYAFSKNEIEEDDIEMEQISSNSLAKQYHEIDEESAMSHTPSSNTSSNSVIRERPDISKSGSSLSNHFLHDIDMDDMIHNKNSYDQSDSSIEQNLVSSKFQEKKENLNEDTGLSRNPLERLQIKCEKRKSANTSTSNTHNQQVSAITENVTLETDTTSGHELSKSPESTEPTTSTNSRNVEDSKIIFQKPTTELFHINEDAHSGPMNVFEFDGLQILVPSTFIGESSEKAISGTSQQSMSSSEGGTGADEEIKSINMRADESMPPRGELSEQESNECTDQSSWQVSFFIHLIF